MRRLLLAICLCACEVDSGAEHRPDDQKVDEKCWYTTDIQARRDCQLVRAVAASDAGTSD